MEADEVCLDVGLSIRRVPDERVQDAIRVWLEAWQDDLLGLAAAPPEYCLELCGHYPKVTSGTEEPSIEHPINTATRLFGEVCTALRLFKKGELGFDFIRAISVSLPGLGGGVTRFGGQPTNASRAWPQYSLSAAEIAEFLDFWQLFRKCSGKTGNGFETALRRFNLGYGRVGAEDRLVDHMIGFEALLLSRGERQELSYRLALRGSALLGENPEDRRKVFHELKAAYTLRSDVVHGAKPKVVIKVGKGSEQVQVGFAEFVERVEDLLRLTLIEFLVRSRDNSEEKVVDELDWHIQSGSSKA